jgi:hypothetical protein
MLRIVLQSLADAMDLTLPYTLYPSFLPRWIAWGFFLIAIIGAIDVSAVIAKIKKPWVGLVVFYQYSSGF